VKIILKKRIEEDKDIGIEKVKGRRRNKRKN
jgi:hypothetical protein